MSGVDTDTPLAEWREHPDFSIFSDARLDLAQETIDDEIRWAQKVGNAILATYKEQEMRLLQAERGRRQGGQNAIQPLENKLVESNFKLQLGVSSSLQTLMISPSRSKGLPQIRD